MKNEELLHIGFDAKRLFFNRTGLGNYSRTLVQNLHRVYPAHTYHLYSPNLTDAIKASYPYFQEKNFVSHTNDKSPSSLWRSWKMPDNWKNDALSIFHGLSNELPLKKSSHTKTLVTIHDLIFKRLPSTYSRIDRLIYDKKVRWSCERADKIIAISEHTKKDLIECYQIAPQKIEVVYQAVADLFYQDTPISCLKEKPDLPSEYILCVGTLQHRKNQMRLLQAWQLLSADLQIPIVFVGTGREYQQRVANYAHRNKIPVYFLTNIKKLSTLKYIYQKAHLFVYPSLYEGFGLPVVEAQLCKVPVITSDFSALPEAASAATILVNPLEIEAISRSMEKALIDTALRQNMVKVGYEFARKQFDPLRLSEQMMGIYRAM